LEHDAKGGPLRNTTKHTIPVFAVGDEVRPLFRVEALDTINPMNSLLRASRLLAFILAVCASTVLAQAPTKRLVHVTVTDPLGRYVTHVERANFGVVENGVRRPITDFTELRNEYIIGFEAANPSAEVEVVLQQPRGLPPLRANLKR
jgi:hypothetical protein